MTRNDLFSKDIIKVFHSDEVVKVRCFFCGGLIKKRKKTYEKMKEDKCPAVCLKCCGVDGVIISARNNKLH